MPGVVKRVAKFLKEGPCPDCRGSRYAKAAFAVKRKGVSLPELMAMSVDEALEVCADLTLRNLPHKNDEKCYTVRVLKRQARKEAK